LKDRYLDFKNLIGAILLFSLLIWGCKKGDQTLGINLLPGVKVLETKYYKDVNSISTNPYSDTKIRVDRPKYNLLGSFNDPLFGRTDASFAAQFRLPYHPDYDANSSIESIVLRMYFKIIYGDTVSVQNFKVFELTNGLNYDAKYLSSFNIKNLASAEQLGSGTFIPKLRMDSARTDTTQQVISVRLSNSFGTRLLGIDTLKMISNDVFTNVFKGLYIESAPVSRKGTLVSIDPTSSSLVLYYHNALKDTLGFAYRISKSSANVAGYVHDYSRARFKQFLDTQTSTDSLIYVQPTGGIRTKIMVPTLSKWQDSTNYIINKATLTIHADTIMSDYRRYAMPERLYLKVITDTGEEEFPKDSELSSEYYGGYYDSATSTYSFNITQHMQKLMKGLNTDGTAMHNNGFYLVHNERNSSGKRVVLKGARSALPIEFDVTYTRFK
jgi:hypothetical protein